MSNNDKVAQGTPRTDAIDAANDSLADDRAHAYAIMRSHARQLERELAAAEQDALRWRQHQLERAGIQPSSGVATLGRDQIIERVEAYFKRVEKLGGDTGECSAAGIADFMLWQSDTENFAANVSLQSASSASPWISVKERLPDPGSYLVRVGRQHQPLLAKYELRNGIDTWDYAFVTHWMPIPEAPA